MNKTEAPKYYSTYIKSAQGTVGLALILNLVYIIRAVFAKNLDFWFSFYITEFAVKASEFAPSYQGSVSKLLSAVIIVVSAVVLIAPVALAMKKPEMLYPCLVLYALDTAFMAWGFVTNHFGDFSQASFIDVIFHVFVLFFIVLGIISGEKLKKFKA